jgi:hypothetical protein
VTHPPLSIALSEDDGLTFPYVRDLDTPTEPHIKLSHPTVRHLNSGSRLWILKSIQVVSHQVAPAALLVQALEPLRIRCTTALPPALLRNPCPLAAIRMHRSLTSSMHQTRPPPHGGLFGLAGVPTHPAGYTGDGSRADSGIPPAALR